MKIADISTSETRFFLKSVYGSLSVGWPIVSVTTPGSETSVRRHYRSGRDLIIYLGTQGEEIEMDDRGNLLSVADVDTTRVYKTYDYISEESREWAEKNHPGQWLRGFRTIRGFNIPSRPNAVLTLPNTNTQMWHATLREIANEDRPSILDIEIDPIDGVDILSLPGRTLEPIDLTRPENKTLSQEALRLAQLVFNRVQISGQIIGRRAPERSAPTDLHLQILGLLKREPLRCALCGATMDIVTTNKLLKISGDRKDSSLGDYGPNNYQLVHYACNLAKNNATQSEFEDWLKRVTASFEDEMEIDNEQQ